MTTTKREKTDDGLMTLRPVLRKAVDAEPGWILLYLGIVKSIEIDDGRVRLTSMTGAMPWARRTEMILVYGKATI